MAISLDLVKELREKTQASLSDCKNALEESKGDMAKAEELLRVRGKKIAEKKADRAANAGLIESYVHPNGRIGVLVELRCETDFVAKNDLMKNLAHDIALQIAAMAPEYVKMEDVPAELVEKERNNYLAEANLSKKTAEIVKKMVDGKVAKHFEEKCLLMQDFVKDPSKKVKGLITDVVGKLGENVRVERFVRLEF